jgi:hypothetical protein
MWKLGRTSLLVTLALLVVIMAGCGDKLKLTANQKRGKQIYEGLCDKCHKLIDPRTHTDEQWIAAADKYSVKLKLRLDEVALLKEYLTRANDSI